MGALTLKHKSHETTFLVFDYFKERGFSKPFVFQLNDWILELYQKTLVKNKNYCFIDNDGVFCVGTLIYKNRNLESSICELLQDQINNKLELGKIYGIYILVFFINNEVSILKDLSNLSNLYYNEDKTIISSSFLATCNYHPGKLTLNTESINENLCTGYIIGSDTIFNEIRRLESSEDVSFDGIQIINPKMSIEKTIQNNFTEAVNEQVSYLEDYFKSTAKIVDTYGSDSGLTGGFDSRLLMILALKYYKKIDFHSFYRNQKSIELDCAKELSIKAKKELKIVPVTNPLDMDQDKLLSNISSSFIYCDGHIRKDLYWHEEYNTLDHRIKILGKNRFGLHGIGGEQYRNEERIIFERRNLKKWIKYELIYKISGKCFINKSSEEEFVVRYRNKIANILGIDKETITRTQIKQYYSKIHNPYLRGVRTNIENADIYFLSPFADYLITEKAYNAIPYLGLSTKFEQEMIKRLNPQIASIKSDYGYNFFKGEPYIKRWLTIVKEIIPDQVYYTLYLKRKKSHNDYSYWHYIRKFPALKDLELRVEKLGLPLNLEIIKRKSDLFPLIWAMGFTISKFDSKLR